jgi:hypothetical protein
MELSIAFFERTLRPWQDCRARAPIIGNTLEHHYSGRFLQYDTRDGAMRLV